MTFWSEALDRRPPQPPPPAPRSAGPGAPRTPCVRFFRVLRDGVDKARPGAYEFLVAGLNPHAGENGLLGRRRSRMIGPAVDEARASGIRHQRPASRPTSSFGGLRAAAEGSSSPFTTTRG